MLTRKQRSLIAKICLGVFPINLKLGRYNSIPRNERYCPVCNSKEVENEFSTVKFIQKNETFC